MLWISDKAAHLLWMVLTPCLIGLLMVVMSCVMMAHSGSILYARGLTRIRQARTRRATRR